MHLKIGVIGNSGRVPDIQKEWAYELGSLIAKEGWRINLQNDPSSFIVSSALLGFGHANGVYSYGIGEEVKSEKIGSGTRFLLKFDDLNYMHSTGHNALAELAFDSDFLIAIGDLSDQNILAQVALKIPDGISIGGDSHPVIILGEGEISKALAKSYSSRIILISNPKEVVSKIKEIIEGSKKYYKDMTEEAFKRRKGVRPFKSLSSDL